MSSERSGQDSSSFEEACAAIHAHSMAVLMSVVPSETFSSTIRQHEAGTGNSLLHVAAQADFSGALRYLILQCNHHVRTTKDGHPPVVPSEVISLQNNEGKTALHIAMQRGNISVITVLRDASERLKILEEMCDIKDVEGNTIMDVAASPDLQALVAVGLDRHRVSKYQQYTAAVSDRHSSPEPSPPANRQDSATKANPRRASLQAQSSTNTATASHDEPPSSSTPSHNGAVRSSVSPTQHHSSSTPHAVGRYNNSGMVGSAAVSMDNQSTGSSPQVASSQDLQQILTMQQRMMSILEHLPQSTNLMNTSSSTASSPLRPLQDGSGSAATQLTTTTTDPDPLSDTFRTAEGGISNRRLLHMLVLAGESSERHAVERDCLKSYLSIMDRYHQGTRKVANGEREVRRASQLVTPSPPTTLLPIISTQQFRAESETGSTGQCSSRSATATYLPHPTSTQSYGSGLRSTVSTKDASTCTSDRPLLTLTSPVVVRENTIDATNDNNNKSNDRLNRSVLMVHGERHVAGQEVDLLIQWRGEEGADDWAPLSEVSNYAVVQAYLARKRGRSSSTNYGSPISSAGGFARMGSPLGETERDDLSTQLAALQRVSTGGGLESGGHMGIVGGDGGGGMIQWYPMQPPALETLFDRGRMEPSFVAIQSDLLMAAIACQDIGTSQTPIPTSANGGGYTPVAWNTSAPSSAGFVPIRSNLTPIHGAQIRRRNPSSNQNIVQTPLGFGKGPAVAVRHSSEMRWGIHNNGSRAASSPMTSKRVSRELPPRRNHQVVLPPSRGLLPEEYQSTDLQDVDEVLPPPPQRVGRGGNTNHYNSRGYPSHHEGGGGERAVSPQELLRALDHADVGSDDEGLDSPYDDDLAGTTTRLTRTPTERETETILSHFTEKMRNLELRHQACRDRSARSGVPSHHPSGIPKPLQVMKTSPTPTINVAKKLLELDNVVSDSGEVVVDSDGGDGPLNHHDNTNYEEVLQDEEQEEARQSWRSLDSSEASDIRNMLGSDDQDVPDEEEEEPVKEINNNNEPKPPQTEGIKPPPAAEPTPTKKTTPITNPLPIKYDQQFVYRGKGGKRSLSPSANMMLADGQPPTILQSSMDGESSVYPPETAAAAAPSIIKTTPPNTMASGSPTTLKSSPTTSTPTTSALQGRRANSEVTLTSSTSRVPAAPRASTALPPISTGTPVHLPPALKGGNAPRSTPGSAIGGTRQVRFESNPTTPDDSKLPWIPRYGAPPPSRPSRLAPLD